MVIVEYGGLSNMDAPNLGLPLVFMYEGMIYSKEIDGTYHKFHSTDIRIPSKSLASISIGQAREIFTTAKFISSIIVLTNNVSRKI